MTQRVLVSATTMLNIAVGVGVGVGLCFETIAIDDGEDVWEA